MKPGVSCGVEMSGKCFCPPSVPQHERDYKGRGTPLPVCAKGVLLCLRCTSLWHRAGLPVGIARYAGTIGPRSKGCDVSRTSRGSHLTGGLTVPMRSGRIRHARAEVAEVQDPRTHAPCWRTGLKDLRIARRWSGHPSIRLSQRALTGPALLASLRRITEALARALTNRWVVLLASSLSAPLPVTTPWRIAAPLHAIAMQHGCMRRLVLARAIQRWHGCKHAMTRAPWPSVSACHGLAPEQASAWMRHHRSDR